MHSRSHGSRRCGVNAWATLRASAWGHVNHLVQTFVGYYNRHRPYQGLGNRVLSQSGAPELRLIRDERLIGRIGCRSELGGLLKSYYRQNAYVLVSGGQAVLYSYF